MVLYHLQPPAQRDEVGGKGEENFGIGLPEEGGLVLHLPGDVHGPDDRLVKRLVTTEIDGATYYSVKEGLKAGDRIVVSDLIPAIDGMLLAPIDDPETASRLARAARAESDVQR